MTVEQITAERDKAIAELHEYKESFAVAESGVLDKPLLDQLTAELAAERSKVAALVDLVNQSVCGACKGTAEIPNGTDWMACGQCAASGDFKWKLASLTAEAAEKWEKRIRAEAQVAALRRILEMVSPDGLPYQAKYPYELTHVLENSIRDIERAALEAEVRGE